MAPSSVLAHLEARRGAILEELIAFASIASVSTDPSHGSDVEAATRWVASALETAGPLTVRVIPTAGNPVVYGEWLGAPGKRTVLVYLSLIHI